MLCIKRTKTAKGKPGQPDTTAVHYATAVHRLGYVEGWSRNRSDAVAVTDGVAARVRDYYATVSNAGVLTFEKVDATAAQLAAAVAEDDAVGAEEFAKLQSECKRLRVDLNAAERLADEAAGKEAAARQREQAALDRAQELEAHTAAQGERIAVLTARVSELEQHQQAATASAKKPKN